MPRMLSHFDADNLNLRGVPDRPKIIACRQGRFTGISALSGVDGATRLKMARSHTREGH